MKIDRIDKTSFEGLSFTTNNSSKAMDTPIIPAPSSPQFYNGRSLGKGKTAAERNNNPLNIKYGRFAASYGATKEQKPALDGGNFATFPDVNTGLQAARGLLLGNAYKNLTVDEAMKKWSNKGYDGSIFKEFSGTKISNLNSEQIAELQKRQIIQEDRGYAKKLGYLKYGGYTGLPKLQFGSFTNSEGGTSDYGQVAGGISAGFGMAGELVGSLGKDNKPNKNRTIWSSVLKGAGSGAAAGSATGNIIGTAAGAIIGGVIGGIKGGKTARQEQEEFDKLELLNRQNFDDMQAMRSSYLYRQFNPYVYKYGGNIINPEFEVEKDEIIRGDVNLTDSKRLTSNIQEVTKYTHDQKNPKTGTTGVLGEGSGQVYSNSIYINGTTPAIMAKSIAKTIGKVEKDLDSKDTIKRRTAELITNRGNRDLDTVFMVQEGFKGGVPYYKYGGYTKFQEGGSTDIEEKIKSIEAKIKEQEATIAAERKAISDSNTSKAEKAKQLLVNDYKKRELDKERVKYKKLTDSLNYTQQQYSRRGSNAKNWLLGLPTASDVQNKLNKAREELDALNTRTSSIESLTPNDFNVFEIGSTRNNNYGIAPKANSRVSARLISSTLPESPTIYGSYRSGYNPGVNRYARPAVTNTPSTEVPTTDTRPTVSKLGSGRTKPTTPSRAITTTPSTVQGPSFTNYTSSMKTPSLPTYSEFTKKVDERVASTPSNGSTTNDGFQKFLPYVLSGAGYLSTQGAINRMETRVPANLTMSPYYGYTDRSRLARNQVDSMMQAILRNPAISTQQKQIIFAKGAEAVNQINDQENARRMSYDDSFAARQLQIDAQNNQILNAAGLQSMENRNNKRMLSSNNFNSLLTNLNTAMAEQERIKLDRERLGVIERGFGNIYGTDFVNRYTIPK